MFAVWATDCAFIAPAATGLSCKISRYRLRLPTLVFCEDLRQKLIVKLIKLRWEYIKDEHITGKGDECMLKYFTLLYFTMIQANTPMVLNIKHYLQCIHYKPYVILLKIIPELV